jgi:hemolysin III
MEELISKERKQTLGEEIANGISHGVGALAAIAVTPWLIMKAIPLGAMAVTGVSIFAFTMILLYLASTLYHVFTHGKTKKIFRVFDHSGIYLLIAGTYTPFTLSVLNGPWGWTLFGIIWGLAIMGIVMKSVNRVGTSRVSMFLYLGMGWLAIIAAKPLYDALSTMAIVWLLAGGVMYSLGVIFFATDHRVKFNHFVWHLFVLAGTACHVIAISIYAF